MAVRRPMPMKLSTEIDGANYRVDLPSATSIAMPQRFDAKQPNLFGVPAAKRRAVESGDFIGDTSRGGSCNVDAIHLIPHCHGTHTESVSHIVDEEYWPADLIDSLAMPSALISVTPKAIADCGESYPGTNEVDLVITSSMIAEQLDGIGSPTQPCALVIRTMPNDEAKLSAVYDAEPVPPFFTTQAIEFIISRKIKHLLIDLPSIDRVLDGGKMVNHHLFWNVKLGSRKIGADSRIDQTITEFIFVNDKVRDGIFLLNLQLPDFRLDAAPSRPLLIPLVKAD